MSINLWIFMFMNLVVLLPAPSKAATTSAKLSNFTYSETYKSGEDYTVKVNVTGSGTVGITAVSSLGRQVGVPKSFGLNGSFNFDIRCGDTVTLTIDGVAKIVKSPACTNEVSTCQNPTGWVEAETPVLTGAAATDPSISQSQKLESKGSNWTRYFYAVDKKTIRFDDNPKDNPEKFLGVICAGTSKQNYSVVDSSGKETGKFQKVSNKIIAKEFGKFSYVSSGNDYKAYFAKNAGDGFYFETKDGTKIEVVNVSVGGVKLNSKTTPSLNVDSITYYSVLPDIDLVYQLDNEGVSKQLILRNQNALKNNLSKIEFTLAGGDLKKESPTKAKLDQKIVDAKVDKNSTNVVDIKKQKEVVTNVLPVAKGPTLVKVDDKVLNDLAASKSAELDTLAKKIDSKESIDITTELDRIDNLPEADETVTLKSGDSKIQIDLPVSYSQNATTLFKSESVKVSVDGKKLTILPDITSLKKLDSKSFPYIIDPRFYSNTGAAEDTYIGNDYTRVGSRGYQRAMVVGGRPEGGYASAYVQTCGGNTNFNGNCNIGDAQAFIKFYIPGGLSGSVATTYLILRQYGSWNTGGFRSRIIASGNFSEGTLHYYNQPPTYGDYGFIDFTGNNVGSYGAVEDRVSSDLSQYVREGNTTVVLKVMDDSAATRSATFCSKDGNTSPCYNSGYGPLLQINLKAVPPNPANNGPVFEDHVAGCTGQSCKNSMDQGFNVGGLSDGFANCIASNIYDRKWEQNSFSVWRNPNYVGNNWQFYWDMADRRVTDLGGSCGGSIGYFERKLGGTYYVHHQQFNEDGLFSGDSADYPYVIDTSAPVQITANTTNIPSVKNNGNISFTVPEFVDDAAVYVSIENAETGVIDANGLGNIGKDTQVVSYIYPSYAGGVAQQWVIESNGQIRTLADGRCLTYQGGNLPMTTLRCQFNSSYTTNAAQGYEYLPETKQIRLINDRYWCFAKEGSSLMLRQCTTGNNQKWNIVVRGNPTWTYNVDSDNKKIYYHTVAADASTGAWVKEVGWTTDRNTSISNLQSGKKYNFYVQTKDRNTGTANYTDFILLGSTTIDTSPPTISNYTETTPVFSPNNATSVGTLDTVTFTYDYLDQTPYAAFLDIFPAAGGALTRRLPYNSAIVPSNLPAIQPNNIRQYFQWDGKDQNGVQVADGTYVIRALAVDGTCAGIDWYSPNCNRFDSYAPNGLKIKVDNSGANISVTTPTYNIWTNNKNYVLTGGLAVYNKARKEDKDVSELYINNVKSPFGTTVANNYSYTTNLNLGANTFTISTKDQAGNTISVIGDPAISTVANWVVNYDNTIPKINSVTDTTPAGTVKSTKSLKISYSDTGSNVNPANIVMDLYTSSDGKSFYKSQNLVNSGNIINTTYAKSLNCSTSECNLTMQNLQDGFYKLFVSVSDLATNTSCTFFQVPYSCQELATFDKIIEVGTPIVAPNPATDNAVSRGLLSVNMFPTYDGINSADTLKQLANGTKNIDQVQGLTVKIKVTQGTEAADIAYSYDTNIDPKKIATLNNTIDSRAQYLGRNGNVANTQNSYLIDKNNIGVNKCDKTECEWVYTIPYDDRFGGGFPKLNVTVYKGLNSDFVQKTWEVNGQLKGDPRVLTFNKTTGTLSENANVYSNIFYTNSLTNRIEFAADASKTYTITIRNGANAQNYTFVNDQYGSQYVDVNLPNVDGNYEIVYNGIVIQKFVLDRVVPTLVNVKTTNLTSTRAIIPFIRRGDNVQFDYATSEPVWESNLVLDQTQKVFAEKVTKACPTIPAYTLQYGLGTQACNDAWRNSTQNTSKYQINNFTPGVAQGSDGVVSPKIELVDYAGNKGSYSSTETAINYSQTPRGVIPGNTDFRLFADSVGPDKSDFDTSTWLDGKDGVNADGLTPENDRLSNNGTASSTSTAGGVKWVIRGTTITFKARGEKNARAVFVMNGTESIANASSTNCVAGNNTVVGGLVTKFGELCDLSFSYNWLGQGQQDSLAQALDYQNFQFYTVDLSGNSSGYSSALTIWNDRAGSVAPNLVSLVPSDTTRDPKTGEFLKPVVNNSITRAYSVFVTTKGESKSDVVSKITNPKGVSETAIAKHGQTLLRDKTLLDFFGKLDESVEFALGKGVDDVNTTMVNDRRVGTESDGIYSISTLNVDTAGNYGAETITKIERDTVAPLPPTATTVADEDNFSVSLKVSGEAGTTAVISGASSSEGPIANPVQGIWKGNYVYGGTYVWNVALRDRAGNVSAPTSVSYTTKAAPVLVSYSLSDSTCKVTDANKLLLPFVGQHDLNSGWGSRNLDEFHFGYDYNLAYGEKVLSAGAGTIKGVFWDTVGGGGNMVTIDHGNGIITWYAHLSQQLAKVGDKVVAGTEIGRSGNSGVVTGAHLHFQVMLNGVASDPKGFMYNCDQKPQPDLKEKVEDTPVVIQGTAGNPWNGKTYADVALVSQITNVIDVYSDEKGNVTNTSVSDTKSYISYEDDQPDKITIYGFAPPKNSTWVYRVHRKLASNVCVVSSTTCQSEIITETKVANSTATIEINLIDKNEPIYNTSQKPKSLGTVTNLDSLGRWSITFNKVSAGVFKNSGSPNNLVIGQGFSLSTVKTVNFNSSEFSTNLPTWFRVDDTKSNIKAISPEYKYTSLDQNLFVTGNWKKSVDAYYSETYLDTRIVRLVPVVDNNPIFNGDLSKLPSSPTTINLFAHGWTQEKPKDSTNRSIGSNVNNWINGKDAVKMDDKSTGIEDSIDFAKISSSLDKNALNIGLVWRDASIDARVWAPTEASKWIRPVAENVAKHLLIYVEDKKINVKLNCVGHSLGTFMCNEIGFYLKGKSPRIEVDRITALDPANEGYDIFGAHLFLDVRSDKYVEIDYTDYFSKYYKNSVAYYTDNFAQKCGNMNAANTAQIVINLDFKFWPTSPTCQFHTELPGVYKNIMKGNRTVKIEGDVPLDKIKLSDFGSSSKIKIDGIVLEKQIEGNRTLGYMIRDTTQLIFPGTSIYGTNSKDANDFYPSLDFGKYNWGVLIPVKVYNSGNDRFCKTALCLIQY